MATASAQAGVQQGKVATGSRVKLSIDNSIVGYATIASYSETIGYEPVAVLDQMEIVEHVPVSYDVTFTASRLYLVNESLKKLEYMPKWNNGEGSDKLLANILNMGTMNAVIEDSQSGTALVQLAGVRVTSHNITFGARAVVGEDVVFVATRAIDGDANG
jgi:hypothetical protein